MTLLTEGRNEMETATATPIDLPAIEPGVAYIVHYTGPDGENRFSPFCCETPEEAVEHARKWVKAHCTVTVYRVDIRK